MAIVYTTSFETAVTQSIPSWSADWSEIYVETTGIQVAADRLEILYSNLFATQSVGVYRLDTASISSNDYIIYSDAERTNNTTAAVMARMPTATINDSGYVFGIGVGYNTSIGIWRRISGSNTLLTQSAASGNRVVLTASISGTNPVFLSLSDGTSTITFEDDTANRLETGTVGVFGRQGSDSTATSGFIYDFSVNIAGDPPQLVTSSIANIYASLTGSRFIIDNTSVIGKSVIFISNNFPE